MPHLLRTALLLVLFSLGIQFACGQQKVPDDLIGSYFFGFQWGGSTLTIKADGTFVKESSNCTQVYKSSGTYQFLADRLRFTILKETVRGHGETKEIDLSNPKARKKYLDTDEPFKPETVELSIIRWRPRIYLMHEENFGAFVDTINLGFEPRRTESYRTYFGEIFLREGDEQKDVSDPPSLPPQAASMILNVPITVTVIHVELEGNKTIATVDRGQIDGLRQGMSLVLDSNEPSYFFASYRIISVSEQTAKVEVPDAKLGETLTTRLKDVSLY